MADSIDKTNTKDLLKAVEQIKDIIQTQQTITDINNRINDWEIRLSEMREKYYDLDTDKIKNDINKEFAEQKYNFNNEIAATFLQWYLAQADGGEYELNCTMEGKTADENAIKELNAMQDFVNNNYLTNIKIAITGDRK